MTSYVPGAHIRVLALKSQPWFDWWTVDTAAYEIVIRNGRDDPGRQPDPPTATLRLYGRAAGEVDQAHTYLVAYYPEPFADGQPVSGPPQDLTLWRFAGRPTDATHGYELDRAGNLVPVATVPLASWAAQMGRRLIANPVAPQHVLSQRVYTYLLDGWDVAAGMTPVNTVECKAARPQDPAIFDGGPTLTARPNRTLTEPVPALQLGQQTLANAGGVLRWRRCGQGWFSRAPFATTPPLPFHTFTDARAFTLADTAAGWNLSRIVNSVAVRWGPNYTNPNETTYAGTVGPLATPASVDTYGEAGPVVIDSELTTAANADLLARAVLARRAWPRRLIPRLTVDLTNPAISGTDRAALLELDLGNAIALDTGTELDALVGLATVEGINETITPGAHRLTLSLISAETEPT